MRPPPASDRKCGGGADARRHSRRKRWSGAQVFLHSRPFSLMRPPPIPNRAAERRRSRRSQEGGVMRPSGALDVYELKEDVGPAFSRADLRDPVPTLPVSLDELESSDNDLQVHPDNIVPGNMVAKLNRRRKKKAKEERERDVSSLEERNLVKGEPNSLEEFEKLVRSSHNSSFVWIKYMDFMLSIGDVEKARAISERALKTIDFREEGEKLNIWVARLNLENEYGTPPEEAVKGTFRTALQYCDTKKLHFALLELYERTNQHKLAEELLKQMTKKFKGSCKVWLRRVQYLLKQGKDEVQLVVKGAPSSLPVRKHMKFRSHAAILEFKCGVPDRGRSMFENILQEYPKRRDIWSIYVDQEVRLGDVDNIRALFERASTLSLPPKKMKFFLTKYLNFEKSLGDKGRVEYVMKKAMDYAVASLV